MVFSQDMHESYTATENIHAVAPSNVFEFVHEKGSQTLMSSISRLHTIPKIKIPLVICILSDRDNSHQVLAD